MNYILVAIFLWCNVSSLHCIFGVMYMHFWYAMHRQLCWCLVGVITIVQCIFGALFLGLGCNIFLVLRLWYYAMSAISRRLATAVAHLLYSDENLEVPLKNPVSNPADDQVASAPVQYGFIMTQSDEPNTNEVPVTSPSLPAPVKRRGRKKDSLELKAIKAQIKNDEKQKAAT